jgi:cyclophilin family peptidyl-prolyl cis-trans isomerase
MMRRTGRVQPFKRKTGIPVWLLLIVVSLPMWVMLFLMSRVHVDTTQSSSAQIAITGINGIKNNIKDQRADSVDRMTTKGDEEVPPKNVTLVECTVINPMAPDVPSSTTAANAVAAGTNPPPKRGVVEITVRNDLSPKESAAFVHLVRDGYYDGVFIFRVLKGFVAQWGNRNRWDGYHPLKTDQDVMVHDRTLSNARGTLSFTGGNPAVRQVFVNMGNNKRLDKEKSRPFATVSETSMTNVIDLLYDGYKDGQGQVKAMKEGDETVMALFPNMSRIEQCHVVLAFSSSLAKGTS